MAIDQWGWKFKKDFGGNLKRKTTLVKSDYLNIENIIFMYSRIFHANQIM
jgi:hypothetical protein